MSNCNNGKTYSFDVCSTCNVVCCQDANPPLSAQREKSISNFLTEQKISVKNAFVHEGYAHPAADSHCICVFFNKKTKRCSIHQVKPETCKAGPITFDINLKTGKVEWFLKKREICAFAGELHDDKEAFKTHFEAGESELMRLISELDVDSLRAILKIEEPQTVKVGEANLPKEILEKFCT